VASIVGVATPAVAGVAKAVGAGLFVVVVIVASLALIPP
jgi:hypothetical protein